MLNYIGATVSGFIAAPAEQLWALISDVTRHPELAGSGEVMETHLLTDGPVGVGTQFQSQQNMRGMRYTTVSHVVACDEPHRLAWRIGLPGTPPFAQVWQFELQPQGEGTLVKHGVALPYVFPLVPPFTLFTNYVGESEIKGMEPTLSRLAAMAGVAPPSNIESRPAPPESAAALLPSTWLQGSLWLAGTAMLGALAVRHSKRD